VLARVRADRSGRDRPPRTAVSAVPRRPYHSSPTDPGAILQRVPARPLLAPAPRRTERAPADLKPPAPRATSSKATGRRVDAPQPRGRVEKSPEPKPSPRRSLARAESAETPPLASGSPRFGRPGGRRVGGDGGV
jgi:hypothetical protein